MAKKKRSRTIFYVLGLVGVGLALFLFIGLGIRADTIGNIDISKVPDGVYTGKLTGSRFSNEVEVTVADSKITEISVVKDMVVKIPGLSTQLFEAVIHGQTLQVDAVAAATVSSKAYLKSLENALTGR